MDIRLEVLREDGLIEMGNGVDMIGSEVCMFFFFFFPVYYVTNKGFSVRNVNRDKEMLFIICNLFPAVVIAS